MSRESIPHNQSSDGRAPEETTLNNGNLQNTSNKNQLDHPYAGYDIDLHFGEENPYTISDIERLREFPNNTRPDITSNEDENPLDSERTIPPYVPPIYANGSVVDIIIDGEVVSSLEKTSKKRQYTVYASLIILTLLTVGLGTTFIPINSKKIDVDSVSFNSIHPTTVQSISPAPTTLYKGFLREMFLPISGESLLDDESSVQHLVLNYWASNFPKFLEATGIQLNDTFEITQHYIVIVTQLSMAGDLSVFEDTLVNPLNYFIALRTCQMIPCNDKGEVTVFGIANQGITSNGLGTIAREISELKSLTDIVLVGNKMWKTIPSEIGRLKHLRNLDIHDNLFTGTIPTEIGHLNNLEILDMNTNFFNGTIPTELGNLSKLFYMDVSQNSLEDSVPVELGNLMNLEGFQVWGNAVKGSVEFLCDKNMTPGSFSFDEININTIHSYTYSGDSGIIVDCVEGIPILECSCCICAVSG